ncbi:hypothetical protein TI04_02955 [Achromatium sp. WMS2]|nr:hypothetical protein TI04_02955 [Achromatium sp. WMS2]
MMNPVPFVFSPGMYRNEREVESKFIVSYLLPILGYDLSMWCQEIKQHEFRLDFLAYITHEGVKTPKIIIETKHPNQNLIQGRYQLKRYMLELSVDYGVLTNGYELVIYQRDSATSVEEIFRCQVQDIDDNIKNIYNIIGRQQIAMTNNISDNILEPTKEPQEMKILAVFHNKGGVGKTTTTVNLADAIARTGKKVLIIDIDSQANATFATGLVNFSDNLTDDIKDKYVFHLLHYPKSFPIEEVARKARYSNQDIDVVPAHIDLMSQETALNKLGFINNILLNKLKKSTKPYDVVLIDTPPSLNLYARISLLTADYLLIPSDLKIFANAGLSNVKNLIEETNSTREMDGLDRPPIQVIGILPTKILTNPRYIQNLKSQQIPRIEKTYGLSVLQDLVITERVDLARCLDGHIEMGELNIPDPQSIFEYSPTSPAVAEFENLANYVLQQMGLSK